METEQSYEEILEITRRRANNKIRRLKFINIAILGCILVMLVSIFMAISSYNQLNRTRAKLLEKNIALAGAKAQIDSLLTASQQAKLLSEQRNRTKDSLIIANPMAATTIIGEAKKNRDTALFLNKRGYELLKERDFPHALKCFQASENAYNGFADSYEMAFLLRKNRDKFNSSQGQEYLMQTIYSQYNKLRVIKETNIK